MNELQTILGTDIPIETRGIVYFGIFNHNDSTLKITDEAFFNTPFEALHCYANIPNPESQMVSDGTYDELITKLLELHKRMKTKNWLEDLAASI